MNWMMTTTRVLVRILPYIILLCVNIINMALDVNECLSGNGGCTQNCSNTAGSYQCYCDEGYELSSDDHTCVGKMSPITFSI